VFLLSIAKTAMVFDHLAPSFPTSFDFPICLQFMVDIRALQGSQEE